MDQMQGTAAPSLVSKALEEQKSPDAESEIKQIVVSLLGGEYPSAAKYNNTMNLLDYVGATDTVCPPVPGHRACTQQQRCRPSALCPRFSSLCSSIPRYNGRPRPNLTRW